MPRTPASTPHPPHERRKRIVRALEFSLLFLVILLYFVYPIAYAWESTRPAPSTLKGYAPSQFGQAYEDVSLVAADSVRLSGWYIPSRNRAAIILLHGYGSSRLHMFVHAEILARHGYGVLLYDERASGLSQGSLRSYGWQDLDDVPVAIAFLKARADVDPRRIGIAGISTGAEIALGAACRSADLRAVIADGAGFPVQADMPPPATFEDWYMKPLTPLMFGMLARFSGIQPPQSLTSLVHQIAPRPLLLISTGTGLEKRQAEYYLNLASDPKVHWNLPKSTHGHAIYTNRQEYEQRMIDFYDQALLGEPIAP